MNQTYTLTLCVVWLHVGYNMVFGKFTWKFELLEFGLALANTSTKGR